MTHRYTIRSLVYSLLLALICCFMQGCRDKGEGGKADPIPPVLENRQTLLLYLPWTGPTNNLISFFRTNISDMENAVAAGVLENERVLVYLASTATHGQLFEIIRNETGGTERVILEEYENPDYTTVEHLSNLLNDMKQHAPAQEYAMAIGSHGKGWIPVATNKTRDVSASIIQNYWDGSGKLPTRYFGGTSSTYQTDISTLREAISQSGITMEFILFDACYMSCIEVAYELRHVCRHIIASTCEIMGNGQPYRVTASHMFGKEVDYVGIANSFYDFYMNSYSPYATLATIVSEELDSLAAIMKSINTRYTFPTDSLPKLQKFDPYTPAIFFDFGHYVNIMCKDRDLLTRFNEQLERTVPGESAVHTPKYYSMLDGRTYPITHFSGVTTSNPSRNSECATLSETSWYKATH